MSLSKFVFALSCICAASLVHAASTLNCPATLKDGQRVRTLNNASLFEGSPEQLGDLMPDTNDETVWTLPLYQESAQQRGAALYMVCRYAKTKKTVTLQVPQTAKTCSVFVRKGNTFATCE